jgi:serine phosphatase RsbU (regulator of sigma subunit)
VPIIGMGALFTAMLGTTLAEAQGQRRALGRQMARQREIAARLAGELEAARRIQMGSLPTAAAAFPGETRFDIYAFLAPAREVGGDLYDFFRLDADRIFLLVGDVSGKGLPGSLFMAMSKSLCKSIALRDHGDVGSVMRQADREISRDNAESLFVTVWAGIVDAATGEIQYGNAGHDAPYLLFPGRPPSRLSASGGPPLCVVDEFPYEASRYRMRRGEILCVVTDGVTDATNAAGELYGRARLEAVLADMAPEAGPEEVGEAVRRDVERFAAGVEAADDLALLILRWTGPGK